MSIKPYGPCQVTLGLPKSAISTKDSKVLCFAKNYTNEIIPFCWVE